MNRYEVLEIGALGQWRDHHGGFTPARSRDGRRVIDREMATQYVGLTANALEPGEEAGYWHTHSRLEELYVFLEGQGQFALDDDVIEVGPGTVIRVGQDVWRAWRCHPDSPAELRWLCIRAGGDELARITSDGELDQERPSPW